MIDITAILIAKVKDDCFGTTWTDYLTLIKHEGNWQIVMKAFYDHANDKSNSLAHRLCAAQANPITGSEPSRKSPSNHAIVRQTAETSAEH